LNGSGFVKLQRSDTTRELLRDTNAFHLLQVIALRARFTSDPSLDGLQFGQAFIGDYKNYGLTRKQDACARQRLERWGLARFAAVNGKGTIATLLDSRVFSLTDERPKRGQAKGQVEGQLISEGNPHNGDSSGNSRKGSKGTAKAQLGGSNQNDQKERRKENEPPGSAPAGEVSDGRHRQITERWGERFQRAMGVPYTFDGGRDGTALKRFLKSCREPADEILSVASQAWERSKADRFAKSCKNAATIHGLCTYFNDIRVELKSTGSVADGGRKFQFSTEVDNTRVRLGQNLTERPDIYVEPADWRERAAKKWPGAPLPATWLELGADLRNDLIRAP
jgi:hypothetical protein